MDGKGSAKREDAWSDQSRNRRGEKQKVTSGRLHRFAARVARIARLASQGLALAGLLVLLAFAVATLLDGLLRHLINQPIEFVRDSGGLVVAVTVVACFPLALLSRSNIGVNLIDLALPPSLNRIVEAFASILVWLTFFFIAVEFYWLARDLALSNDTTVMLGVPKAPFWYAADVMFWAAVLTQTLIVVTDIAYCINGGPQQPPPALAVAEEAI
jgi:TRAP-type C4-dicarboxylate transport system permease small subunit